MQKLLITIEGVSNSGKTTTLKKIISLLNEDSRTMSVQLRNGANFQKPREFNTLTTGDLTCIFKVMLANNKLLKIGVATGGDTLTIVSSNLTYFDDNNCDVMLCATKSKGKTVDYIHNYIDNKELIFLPFYKTCNTNHHDTKLAQDIIETIWKLVS